MYRNQLIGFSLIYSDIVQKGRYYSKKVPDNLLYIIFNECNKNNIDFFHSLESENREIKKEITKLRFKEKYLKVFDELIKNYHKYYEKVDEVIELCKEQNIKIITKIDNDYPSQLHEIKDFPFVLYIKGKFPIVEKKSIGIIGTRRATNKGKEFAFECGKYLAENKVWNISGLALGIDEYGHKGSLDGSGYTGAILAHGLDQPVYPRENRDLSERILENKGFLMSELPPSTKLNSLFLIQRNRLQAAINDSLLVVETGEKGGTLHTVNYAMKYNKKVYVWEPLEWKGKNINGNLVLLGKREIPVGFKVKNINRFLIKRIKYKEDLLCYEKKK